MKKTSISILRRTPRQTIALLCVAGVVLGGCQSLRDVVQRARDKSPGEATPTAEAAASGTSADQTAKPVAEAKAGTDSKAAVPVKPAADQPAAPPPASSSSPASPPPVAIPVNNSLAFAGTGVMVKPLAPQPVTPPQPGEETFNLNFEAADVRAIAQSIMGDYLHESFSIHPQTTGTATIRMSRPVPKRELIPILEMLLRQNGQVMIKEDGMFKIMPQALGTRGVLTPQIAGAQQLPNGFSTQIVQLKYVGAKDMQRILEPYAVEPATSIRIDEPRNLLVLSGAQLEMKHMLEVVELFDVDFLTGYSIGLFPMQTDVKSLSGDLDRLFGTAGQGTSPLAGIVRIIPIERMNGLLVVTTQVKYLEEAKKWIERLDRSGGLAGGMRLNVYTVKYGKAEKLAQLLTDVYGNRTGTTGPTLAPGQRPATIGSTTTPAPGSPTTPTTPTPTPAPAFNPLAALAQAFQGSGVGVSKDTRIIADADNNALLILASPSDYETILTALRQLDVPRRQVLVEVMIAEVKLNDDMRFGIEWFLKARNNTYGALRNSATGPLAPVLPQSPSLNGATDPRASTSTTTTNNGTTTTTTTGPTVAATAGLQLINVLGGDIRAVLQALGTDGRAKVVSAPRVMVLDNEKATINVGDQISISTGTSTLTGTSGTVTSSQYINTGVILNVTPRINMGGHVTLDVSQEVSAADLSTALGSSGNPNISTRKAQTVVDVASGETMVLAGLIQNEHDSASAGIPLLSKIPIIGAAFGSQSYTITRNELVVLITPIVVNNVEEARNVTEELRKKMPLLEDLIPKAKQPAEKP